MTKLNLYDTPVVCAECNGIVYPDGTVENCAGECGREMCIESDYAPLNFNAEEDIRNYIPEPPLEEIESYDSDYDDILEEYDDIQHN